MAEIEFLHPDPDAVWDEEELEESGWEPGLLRRHLPTTGATLAWAGAAAVCALAPFERLHRTNNQGGAYIIDVDGWGRVTTTVRDDGNFSFIGNPGHETRWGAVLVVAGVLCAVAAVVTAARAWRGDAGRSRFTAVLGLLALGIAGTVAACTRLYVDAVYDSTVETATGLSEQDFPLELRPVLTVGPFWWLAAVAAALAVAGCLATRYVPPAPAAPDAAPPPPPGTAEEILATDG